MKKLALGAAIIAATSLAGVTGALALASIKTYSNAKVHAPKSAGHAQLADKFCDNKGYKNVYYFAYSHYETNPSHYGQIGIHVYTTIQCTNAAVG